MWGTGSKRQASSAPKLGSVSRRSPKKTGIPKDCLQYWGELALVGKEKNTIVPKKSQDFPHVGVQFAFSQYVWSKNSIKFLKGC